MSTELLLAKDINLAKKQLKNGRVHNVGSDPAALGTADKGLIWFNTTENAAKYWNGSAAVTIGTPPDLTNYYTKTETNAQVSTGVSSAVTAHEGLPDPHAGYQRESEKNQFNGYPGLDGSGRIPLIRMGGGAPLAGRYVDGGTGNWTNLSSGHAIQDEGNARTQRSILNFVGPGVSVADDAPNLATKVTIAGGGGGSGASMRYATMYKLAAV